jgi:Raf kinase inhibitor-like YbhB/YbcL family protein
MDSRYRRSLRAIVILAVGLAFATLAMPQRRAAADESQSFSLSSPAFANDAKIPLEFTCSGANQSPPLRWRDAPARTRSYVLIVRDPDARSGNFIHWVMFDIPAATRELKPGIDRSDPAAQGTNGFGRIGYDGPCPPPGRAHHYVFELTALDSTLDLRRGASAAQVESAAAAHRLATTELTAEFAR